MNKLDRQLDLEREMTGLGHRKVELDVIVGNERPDPRSKKDDPKTIHKKSAREAEQESRTAYGRQLLVQAIDVVAYGLLDFLNEDARQAGRHSSVRKHLRLFYKPYPSYLVNPDETKAKADARYAKSVQVWEDDKIKQMRVVAFIGLQSVIDSLSMRSKHTASCVKIGSSLENELRFRYFAKTNPALWATVFGDLTRRESNFDRREAVLKHSMRHDDTGKASGWGAIPLKIRFALGAKLIELIAKTDLVVVKKVKESKRRHSEYILVATDATLEFMRDSMATAGIVNPTYLPAVCSPKKWSDPLSGGYYSAFEELAPVRMVKLDLSPTGVAQLKAIHEARDKMPLVYSAINAVQATPWKVNAPVLEIMRDAWMRSGLKIGKMPKRTDGYTLADAFPLENYWEGLKENEELFARWRRGRAKVYKARVEHVSRVLQMERTFAMAEKFAEEPTIYFPTQLDFRGRMYAMPAFLNPQGTDCAKGLLTFARGCKLGASGWRWLHIHLANMHGQDKLSFDDREEWSVVNYPWIVDCVKDPFQHRQWMEADKPWQFIATAIELVAAVESGDYENYFSHLPVTVDGTCNGLQHFSAMLLDKDGAVSVNLQPSEVPNDIYQIVADKVKAKFATMDDPLARAWLDWGFDRKATKRSVMILPYSGTLHASKEYVRDYAKEREGVKPWEDDFVATAFFAKHVWTTIEETVKSAGTVMRWLRAVSNAVTKEGQTIKWRTPINFMVEQDNRELDQFQVEIMVGKRSRYQPQFVKESERLDKKAQRLGISPNFVHSLDAACLMLTVNRAVDEGIEDFAMVHDSYGVLAGKMDTLYMGLRQAFIDIYQGNVMLDFVTSAARDLPEEVRQKLINAMPTKGSFNLESVRDSKYFFA
jgi:Autographiviridae RNA polymerase